MTIENFFFNSVIYLETPIRCKYYEKLSIKRNPSIFIPLWKAIWSFLLRLMRSSQILNTFPPVSHSEKKKLKKAADISFSLIFQFNQKFLNKPIGSRKPLLKYIILPFLKKANKKNLISLSRFSEWSGNNLKGTADLLGEFYWLLLFSQETRTSFPFRLPFFLRITYNILLTKNSHLLG